MLSYHPVRAPITAFLLAFVIASVPTAFAQATPRSEEPGVSTAQGSTQYAQAPIVRDHRAPTPALIVRDHRRPTSAPGDHEPLARLQLVIKRIIVHDDREWGSGDISINVVVTSRDLACRGGGCITRLVESTLPEFQADSGDERRVDRVVPAAGAPVRMLQALHQRPPSPPAAGGVLCASRPRLAPYTAGWPAAHEGAGAG